MIKLTAVFFLPIFISIFLYDQNKFKLQSNKLLIFLITTCLVFYVLDSFLKSGCLFYPIVETCINRIPWTIDYERVINHSHHVELWAKGFYIQNEYLNKVEFLNNFNWTNTWVLNHFFYKVFEFLIIPILFTLVGFLSGFKLTNYKPLYLIAGSTLSLLYWLNSIPQLRFALSIIIFLFISIFLLLKFKLTLSKKTCTIFLTFLIIIFNLKNVNRILGEFKRSDTNQFRSFPFPPDAKIRLDNRQIKFNLYKGMKIYDFKWFNIISKEQ